MQLRNPTYAITRHVEGGSFDAVLAATRAALSGEGFGVLTEIDVRATLRNKLEVEIAPYVILGACNPPLAHRALVAEPGVGVLLPCNVVVMAEDDGRIAVSAIDPRAMFAVVENAELAPIVDDVRARLARVVDAVRVPA